MERQENRIKRYRPKASLRTIYIRLTVLQFFVLPVLEQNNTCTYKSIGYSTKHQEQKVVLSLQVYLVSTLSILIYLFIFYKLLSVLKV